MVTGASTGIGRACAEALSRRGFAVFGTVRRPEDGQGLERPLSLDVTDPASVEAAAARVADEAGELRGLVNNAGIVVSAPLELVPIEDFQRQLDVNVTGLLRTTQAFVPLLREGKGRIVNVSSTSGRFAFPLLGPYSASKFAVESMSDILRLELEPWDVLVSVVEPGPVRTPIWERTKRTARRIREGLDPAAAELYRPLYEASERSAGRATAKAVEPGAVVRAIEHALFSPRPRTRYLVGRNRLAFWVFTRLLSDRLRDRIVLKRLRSH